MSHKEPEQKELENGFTCECGKWNPFALYVYAHWDEVLEHTCKCNRKHSLYRGKIKLLRQKAKP